MITELRAALSKLANAHDAPAMQRYMKSVMPFYGVKATALRAVCKQVFARHDLTSQGAWQATILALYRGARRREERYAAIELARARRYGAYVTLDALPMLEELIVSGAWWDLVDGVATHLIGRLLRDHPVYMKPLMLHWAKDANVWKRRTAILCQIGLKQETDLQLLFACIEPSLGRSEFFLQKAIGWALRQYAWTDAEVIEGYVVAHGARLSALSRREALKNVGRAGAGKRRGARQRSADGRTLRGARK